MDEQKIQSIVAKALNAELEEPWGAWKATTRDNIELVELVNERTSERYVITIQKGM